MSAITVTSLVPAAEAQTNRVVLRVNDEIATLYDYEQLKREQLTALSRANIPEERKQAFAARVGVDTMQQLFEEMLIVSRASQLGVIIPEDAIDSAVKRAMANFGIETPDQFQVALRQNGMTMDGFREQMRKNLMVREVMGREVQARVVLEEEDLRRYYRAQSDDFREPKRVRLREVVVLDDAGLDEAGQAALAGELGTAIAAGSADEVLPGHEEAGRTTGWIEHGWVEPGDLDAQLRAAVDVLADGEVSEPTRARGGLHLLQVLEVQEAHVKAFQDVRDQIDVRETNRLMDEEGRKYLGELVASSYVDSSPPPEAAGFRPELAAGPAGLGSDAGFGVAQAVAAAADAAAADAADAADAANADVAAETAGEAGDEGDDTEPEEAPEEPDGGV